MTEQSEPVVGYSNTYRDYLDAVISKQLIPFYQAYKAPIPALLQKAADRLK